MAWTQKDIENLKLKTNLKSQAPKRDILKGKSIVNGKISVEKEAIKTILWLLHRNGTITKAVEELQFLETRKFRFDWAITDIKVAIEYEGVISKKSRHTTISGFSKDCEKYNLAQIEGWKVLRYTALNYQNLESDLKNLLKK